MVLEIKSTEKRQCKKTHQGVTQKKNCQAPLAGMKKQQQKTNKKTHKKTTEEIILNRHTQETTFDLTSHL